VPTLSGRIRLCRTPVYLDIEARRPRADTRPSYRNCQARQEALRNVPTTAARQDSAQFPVYCSAPRVQARQESIPIPVSV
jgi:hypothetical protein